MIGHAYASTDFVSSLQVVAPNEFLGDCDGIGIAKPTLNIQIGSVEIRRIERAERSVRENIDPKNLEVFAGEIRQRDKATHNRRSSGNTRCRCNLRQSGFREMSGWRGDLQRRLARDQIDVTAWFAL